MGYCFLSNAPEGYMFANINVGLNFQQTPGMANLGVLNSQDYIAGKKMFFVRGM